MKKLVKIVLVIVLLGLAANLGYRHYLPSMIATTLTSDEPPSRLIPAAMQDQVIKLRSKINREIEELPALLKETRLGIEDLEIMIDRANPDDFFRAIQEIKNTTITSTDQVFDILMKHIKIEGYDLEVFRAPFVRNTSVDNIQESIVRIEQNEFVTSMSVPVLKQTVKQILASNKQKILEEMGQG